MALLRTPSGTRDVLPTEAAELHQIEEAVRKVFVSFGYGEVVTPTVEYEEILALSQETRLLTGLRLLDEHGELLLLRPDLTAPIARLAAGRFRGGVPPHRVFTVSNVFRRISPHGGQESEFRQAGAELLGASGPEADAEVIALVCRALEQAGLERYRIGVGQAALFGRLLEALGLSAEERRVLTSELVQKDMVGFRLSVEQLGIADDGREALLALPELRGGAEVIGRAREYVRSDGMRAVVDGLGALRDALGAYGYEDRLMFDLGIFRNFEYYTGTVFEIYAPGLGFTLGGGGRYDNLLARFGEPMPAVGCGIGLDRLHMALVEQGLANGSRRSLVLVVGGLDRHLEAAERLRAQGLDVFALPAEVPAGSGGVGGGEDGRDGGADLRLLASQKDASVVAEPLDEAGSRWRVWAPAAGAEKECGSDGLAAAVVTLLGGDGTGGQTA